MTWFDMYNEFIKNFERIIQLQKDYASNLETINRLYNESIKGIERVNELYKEFLHLHKHNQKISVEMIKPEKFNHGCHLPTVYTYS